LVPSNGRVFIDNCDIRDIDLAYLRENISLVTQESIFFNMSIKENLTLGSTSPYDEESLEKSLILSGADKVIQKLPSGLETIISENATNLSGGERQRLSLARVYYRNSKILLLDEMTSNIDPKTQEDIMESLRKNKGDRTIVMVTHNYNNIKYADRVIKLVSKDNNSGMDESYFFNKTGADIDIICAA
jgi:ABC-type multidrug transport system fused ATPase/permease subunit